MLETYRGTYFHPRTQFITIDESGNVLESDNVLFSLKKGDDISVVSPFFEGLSSYFDVQEDNDIKFTCVHLESSDQKEYTCDIEFKTFAKNQPTLIIIHDFSDHYKYYQEVAQSRNESVINSQILELKNKYLKEKEDFKNTFIANFSHELRNPLTGVTAFCSVLEKTSMTTEQQDYVEVIKSSADHLKNMIGDILEMSKIEVGKLTIEEELFNFHELVEMLEFTYSVKAKQKNIEFEVDFDEKIPKYIESDKTRIKQIFENLIENAFKFTSTGKVTLSIHENQRRARKVNLNISVKDTGIGIPPEKLDIIFNSFTQLNNSQKYSGTGLGLSIVKGLVDLMDGKITVESEEKVGSTFKMNINFKYPINQKNTSLEKKSDVENKNFLSKEKYNILLAEDSELAQMAVLKILAQEGHFFLDIISNGEDVIESMIHNEYDLILMDIRMPGTPGDELTKMIRSLPVQNCKTIPILALTANLYDDDKKRYKKMGMNDIIEKPFDEKTLLKKIYKHLK
ncbi:ATP-binding protein [Kordia algicida OT-1]|uniref:histidine kinase n=1 Tax=Kordia algicida OT-1 TaxID=391587 RepID=A9DLE7_9FLAO|nr:ATP-binding protein [Kordia algicida]EDP98551.1 sensory box histidine kinase/response regulator [Kordia algicida OT-1]